MIDISSATIKDIELLHVIESQVFIPADGQLSKRAIAYHVKKNLLLTYKDGGEIAGYILVLCPKNKSYARLYSLAVLPKFRKYGIATMLIKQALDKIDKNYKKIFPEVRKSNLAAIALYDTFGFIRTKSVAKYYGDKEDAVKMCRDTGNKR